MIPKFEFNLSEHMGEQISDVTIQVLNEMIEHYNQYIVGKSNGR
jgi:hypothetical protein